MTVSLTARKDVYLLPLAPTAAGALVAGAGGDVMALADLVPEIFYNAVHPTTQLVDGQHAGFTVRCRVYLWSPGGCSGKLSVTGSWGQSTSVQLQEPAGSSVKVVNITASASDVKLWWPAGAGGGARGQPLYNITAVVSVLPSSRENLVKVSTSVSATRRVGFRVVSLVTVNDTSPAVVAAGGDGSGGHGEPAICRRAAGTRCLNSRSPVCPSRCAAHLTGCYPGTHRSRCCAGMYFRVNGAALFTRGANSLRRDYHSAAPPSPSSRLSNRDAEGVSVK